ncbi:hypothetical protein QQP08_019811 [Theobroma cacao]|uniref:Uncharacterized protein n=1 Tax=Theobroma cacao TaxID=3641 RepID=A0A061GF58_THECC|nr:Uncharacterized protein TCM_029746 [Theobroma cacao]WRX27324.1 hypothetical protein QQP08_019811 [Theobroma cacao]
MTAVSLQGGDVDLTLHWNQPERKGSQSRPLIEKRNLNKSIEDLRQYLNGEAKKNQNGQVERTSPGGPDPQHHFKNY